MHPVAERLLEQHIEFELEALTGAALQPFLRAEAKRCFTLAEELSLSDCATRQRCIAAFKRLLVKAEFPESAGELALALGLAFTQRLEASGVDVRAVIERHRFLELVDIVADLHEPRRRLVAELFRHPLYGELISSLVYQALVNYLLEDNVISQRVPGVGSMLKLGRKVANRAVPGLDATVERQLKSYIKSYLPSLVKASEQFVESAFEDGDLEQGVAEAWDDLEERKLSGLAEGVTFDDAVRLRDWARRYWDELRRSDFFSDMGETLIDQLYERYGDQPVAVLLSDLGVTRAMVSRELTTFAPPLLKRLRRTGYLGELLRRRLEPFYASGEVAEILGPAPRP